MRDLSVMLAVALPAIGILLAVALVLTLLSRFSMALLKRLAEPLSKPSIIEIDMDEFWATLNRTPIGAIQPTEKAKQKNDETDDVEEYVPFEDLFEKPKRKNDDADVPRNLAWERKVWGVYIVRGSNHPFATVMDTVVEPIVEGLSRYDAVVVFAEEADPHDGTEAGDASGVCWKYFWSDGEICRLELRPASEEYKHWLAEWKASGHE